MKKSKKSNNGITTIVNPPSVSSPIGNYSHAIEVRSGARHLYISGQIPENAIGEVPKGFDEQCEAVWRNISATLDFAGMSLKNLVKVTTFLTHPDQVEQNGKIRRHFLGDLRPALTVVIVQTLESKWLLEIEAIAAAED